MADSPQLPVTVDIAKQNLREAADAMSVDNTIRAYPYQSVATAFAIGMLLARNDRASVALLAREILRYL
ncbi:MAG TPA: hypothetical protein VJ998_00345 [Pseudomonadales bacterium]|nr:hypothetical protein [Pseudomonadales bacterium]